VSAREKSTDPDAGRMKRLLRTRVAKRRHPDGHHYRLDLRLQGLRGERLAIRDPRHPGWPAKGSPARTLEQALEWVDQYVDRLGPEWCRGGPVGETVRHHGDAYLEWIRESKGADSSQYRNHRNCLRNHVYPTLGEEALRPLGAPALQALLDGLRTVTGKPVGVELKRGVLAAVSNAWRHAVPDQKVPWAGKVTLGGENPTRARRERARAGIRLSANAAGFTPAELRQILITALAMDLAGRANPHHCRGTHHHADLVAFLIHHIVRIEEVCFLCRKDIDLGLRAILIAGTKTAASEERLFPTQRAYEPWRDRLLERVSDPEDPLLPTSRAGTTSVATLKYNVARVLEAAGLKRPGECTHVFRASHTSIAIGQLRGEAVAALSGHRIPGDDLISDHYLRWRSFIAGLPESHFDYFPVLGTLEELEEEARAALVDGRIVVPGAEYVRASVPA
jgi:hypothetical protein